VTGRPKERLVIDSRLRRRTILAAIRAARQQLLLSIFRSDDRAVWQALASAARRGVRVRVLMTPHARAAGTALDDLQARLASHGIDVRRYAGGMKYHAKYLVADEHLAVVTTANLTGHCFEHTCDFTLVTCDADVVAGLGELFAADWDARPVRLTAAQRARLIVGPDHAPRDRFAAIVSAARRRIRILDSKLADPRILELLESRRHAGVAVERARRRDVRPLRRHGKLLLVDGGVAVLGSCALSTRALEHRRELAVITRDPRLVAQLDRFWRIHVAHRAAAHDAAAASLEVRP
jgi:cardiolipin synthase A/B